MGKQAGVKKLWQRLKGIRDWELWQDRITRYLILTLAAAVLVGLISLMIYNRIHCFDDYSITASAEEDDVDGTQYQMLGNYMIKYSHDGVFCVNFSKEMIWSSVYTMQTPVAAVCGKTMAIAEQQGKQVFILNESGMIGSFQTSLPIIDVCVSAKGQTALILDDSDATWINLYESDGTQIAGVKTTMSGSGYPVSAAISKDAKRMIVSFLSMESGSVGGKLEFFDFSSASDADSDHLSAVLDYEGRIFPKVYYTNDGLPVAIADDGFLVFTSDRVPKEKAQVELDDEIVSTFYDDSSLGFIFRSNAVDQKYDMKVFGLSGKQLMETTFDFEYEDVRIEDGEILLYDASSIHAYRTSGRAKCRINYAKGVSYFASLSGGRNYLVITQDSMDRIHLS